MKKIMLVFLCAFSGLFCKSPHSALLAKIKDKNVDHVRVEEVLHLLDVVLEELPEFIDKYEFNSNLTWEEWKKKYWLLAPAGGIVLILKFYFIINSIFKAHRPETFYSGYGPSLQGDFS